MSKADIIKQFEAELQIDESLLQALVRESSLPEPVIIEAAQKGAVWVSRQRGRGRTRPQRLYSLESVVPEGSTLMLNYNPTVLASVAHAMQRVSDHVNYSIWFKPSGMLCQGSKWSDHTVATRMAESICNRHCFLVHRLDKAACGLMVIAHTKNSLTKLTALFQQRLISKTYQATVTGGFNHELPLIIKLPIDEREAITTVHAARFDNVLQQSVLSLSIDTGRKHQIRKHLANLGHPIVGDRLYSPEDTVQHDDIDLQLVACALEFRCPFTGKDIATSIDADKALHGNVVA